MSELIYDVIRELYAELDGMPVTVREIQARGHISSTSVVNYHLVKLEEGGRITRSPHIARSIRPVLETAA